MGLAVPVRLEADPYPVAAALELEVVPTLFLVDREGRIARVVEAFNRADLEALAARGGRRGTALRGRRPRPRVQAGLTAQRSLGEVTCPSAC